MKTGLLVTLSIIGVIVLGFGVWGASVLLSNITGAGGAIQKRNSTGNRIEQQARFEDLAANFDGYIIKIRVAEKAVRDAPDKTIQSLRAVELEGLKQECIDDAQEFNAASRKYLARDWKSAGLPASLDATICEGNS